jgi:hypothetical protein
MAADLISQNPHLAVTKHCHRLVNVLEAMARNGDSVGGIGSVDVSSRSGSAASRMFARGDQSFASGFQDSVCCNLETISISRLLLLTVIVGIVGCTVMTVVWSWTVSRTIDDGALSESSRKFAPSAIPPRISPPDDRIRKPPDGGDGGNERLSGSRDSEENYREITTTTTVTSGYTRSKNGIDAPKDGGGNGRGNGGDRRDGNSNDVYRIDHEEINRFITHKPAAGDRPPECVRVDYSGGFFCWVSMGREINKETPYPSAGILRDSGNGASVFRVELQCTDASGKIYIAQPQKTGEISAELAFDSRLNGHYVEISTSLESLTSTWCKMYYMAVK